MRAASARGLLLVALVLIGGGVTAYLVYFRTDRGDPVPAPLDPHAGDAPDPRVAFDTPFRNVRPDVTYVGDAACVECHASLVESYHRHAMGRSAANVTEADKLERYDAAARPKFSPTPRSELRIEREGGKAFHIETIRDTDGKVVSEHREEVVVAIGSGTRGRSYLCVREGTLWQSGISWFSEKQIWDVSPGFVQGRHSRRPIPPDCMFCHVNLVEPVPQTNNTYSQPVLKIQSSVGCERCHGPGSLHVQERKAGKTFDRIDTGIVNPKHLEPRLRDSVCEQCHLQGELRLTHRGRSMFDFRPGVPFESVATVFSKHPARMDYHASVGQFEQMKVSTCGTKSAGKLSCTSCHDPHGSPAPDKKDAFYRSRCNTCHHDKPCNAPAAERTAKNDSCITCHMPKADSSNIAHTAVTDHRVVRRPIADPKGMKMIPKGDLPIVAYHADSQYLSKETINRDLTIAVSALSQRRSDFTVLYQTEGIIRLTERVKQDPADYQAWARLAFHRSHSGDLRGARSAVEKAIALAPDDEETLSTAAGIAIADRRWDDAVGYSRHGIKKVPNVPFFYRQLGEALINLKQFDEADAVLEQGRKINPGDPWYTALSAMSADRRGKRDLARTLFERAIQIAHPDEVPQLRRWYGSP